MSYIMPNGKVYICNKVPLKNNYEHTILFKTKEAQEEYFRSKGKYLFTNVSYQRKDNNVIRVETLADNIMDCNYMMFQNSVFGGQGNFSNKWFYAFITRVEYVNNACSNVYYEIDVMQTWLFDYNLGQCYIERQHSITDNVGDNLVPEDLGLKPFYYFKRNVYNCPFQAGNYKVLIVRGNVKTSDAIGRYQCITGNMFAGVDYNVYTPHNAYSVLKQINSTEGSGGVVAIYQVPDIFDVTQTYAYSADPEESGTVISSGIEPQYNGFIGYTPRNKKLYTQQFYGLICTTSQGDSKQYAYEYFADKEHPEFILSTAMGGTPEAVIYPTRYKYTVQNNFMEALKCTDFPQCSWSNDAYAAWLALNSGYLGAEKTRIETSALFGFTQVALSPLQTNSAKSLRSGAEKVIGAELDAISLSGKMVDIKAQPDIVNGTPGSAISYRLNNVGFTFYNYYPQPDDAERIDKYFDMFGYAYKNVGYPQTYTRKNWNYIKTLNCQLLYKEENRSIPVDDADLICNIYNKGFTFWHNVEHFGDYTQDNSPL